jgi:2-polyprenyl-6-methoxyphenol hydroxylase-like FAD-dependent oxidoreductase
MRSIIIGGGVAGLAMTTALGALPHFSESTILERRPTDAPSGMGFLLMPNGLAALRELAPTIDWSDAGHWIERASLRAADGSILCEHALEPALCVSRTRFLSQLRTTALGGGRARILEGTRVTQRTTLPADGACGDRVQSVMLETGEALDGELFFGCDGAQSRFRKMLFPKAELSDAAIHEIVSIADAPELARELGTTFRKYHDPRGGLAVGMLAEGHGRVVWFVQMDAARYRVSDTSGSSLAAFVDATLDGWAADVIEALSTTDFHQSHLWKTRDLPPLSALHLGNAVLLGDAAHACLPFTSQGANSALVDAVVLARLLRDVRTAGGASEAFAEYTRLRRPNHRRLFLEGRRLRAAFLAPVASSGPALPLVA